MQEKTRELIEWTYEKKCQTLVHALKHRNFKATYCPTADDAAAYILKEAESAKTIGFGGSMSVKDLLLNDRLTAMGKILLNHGMADLTPEQKREVMRRQLTSDLFLTSTNAVTQDGVLVNIDGNGNRVSAMIYGPDKVIIVVGRNKIVDGDINDAYLRIKQFAAPPNVKRLNLKTPCVTTGCCADCDSPDRICNVTTIMERKPRTTDIHVLVVNEDMGL